MLRKFFLLYYDGIRDLSPSGKTLWCIAIIKLIIMFGVFKFWLMPNYLNDRYDTQEEKVEHIYNTLINNSEQQ